MCDDGYFLFLLHRFWSSCLGWYHLLTHTWKMGCKSLNLLLSNWISCNCNFVIYFESRVPVKYYELKPLAKLLIIHFEDVVWMPRHWREPILFSILRFCVKFSLFWLWLLRVMNLQCSTSKDWFRYFQIWKVPSLSRNPDPILSRRYKYNSFVTDAVVNITI